MSDIVAAAQALWDHEVVFFQELSKPENEKYRPSIVPYGDSFVFGDAKSLKWAELLPDDHPAAIEGQRLLDTFTSLRSTSGWSDERIVRKRGKRSSDEAVALWLQVCNEKGIEPVFGK